MSSSSPATLIAHTRAAPVRRPSLRCEPRKRRCALIQQVFRQTSLARPLIALRERLSDASYFSRCSSVLLSAHLPCLIQEHIWLDRLKFALTQGELVKQEFEI